MPLQILPVTDPAFAPYGKVVDGYDFTGLLAALKASTPRPDDGVLYYPSVPELEEQPAYGALQNRFYGGMPIQLGCCNGVNTRLNCLEYHRDSEVDIAADDVLLLLGLEQEMENGVLDTGKVRCFLLPAGAAVELYGTTLHYAPCSAKRNEGFRVVIVLPKGTNLAKPSITAGNGEDSLLWAANKWLLAHQDSDEYKKGAHLGLTGENIDLWEQI